MPNHNLGATWIITSIYPLDNIKFSGYLNEKSYSNSAKATEMKKNLDWEEFSSIGHII